MNHLQFFETPKENLKINMLFKNKTEIEALRVAGDNPPTLPDADKYYTGIYFPAPGKERPYTYSSICLSADGKMAYADNHAGPLVAKNNFLDPDGALGDFWVLNVLRAMSDGLLVGANTLASEPGITCHVYDANLTKQRKEQLKKPLQPVCVVVSLDGTDVPLNHYSFHIDPADEFKQIIATSPNGMAHIQKNSSLKHVCWGPFSTRADVDNFDFGHLYRDFDTFPLLATGEGSMPDSDLLLYILRKLGMERVCVESPSYCAHLLGKGLLDEYFITYSMVYVGGTISPAHTQPFGYLEHPHAELLGVGMHRNHFLFTRQKLRYGIQNSVDLTAYNY